MKMLLAAVAAVTIATPAFASDDNFTVYATVPAVCTIDAPGSAAIDLTQNATTSIGNVTFQCNDPQGYMLARYAQHQQLVDIGGGGSTTTYSYTISDLFSGTGTYGPPLSSVGAYQTASTKQVSTDPDYGVGASATFPVSVKTGTRNGPGYAGTYGDVIRYEVTGQ